MKKKTVNLVVIVVGLLLAIISLTADLIGIGTYPGINVAQLGGAAVGLVIVLIGLLAMRRKPEKDE